MKNIKFIAVLIALAWIALIALTLDGCATPHPFKTGDDVPPPSGCIAARARGLNC